MNQGGGVVAYGLGMVAAIAIVAAFIWLIALALIAVVVINWCMDNPEKVEMVLVGLAAVVVGIVWAPEALTAYLFLFLFRDIPVHLVGESWSPQGEQFMVLIWLLVVPLMMAITLFFAIGLSIQVHGVATLLMALIFIAVTVVSYYFLYFNVAPRTQTGPHPVWPRFIMAEKLIEFDLRVWFTSVVVKVRLWWHATRLRWDGMTGKSSKHGTRNSKKTA